MILHIYIQYHLNTNLNLFYIGKPLPFNISWAWFPASGKMQKSKDVVCLWRRMGKLTLPLQASPKDSEILPRMCCLAMLNAKFTCKHLTREKLLLVSQ